MEQAGINPYSSNYVVTRESTDVQLVMVMMYQPPLPILSLVTEFHASCALHEVIFDILLINII